MDRLGAEPTHAVPLTATLGVEFDLVIHVNISEVFADQGIALPHRRTRGKQAAYPQS